MTFSALDFPILTPNTFGGSALLQSSNGPANLLSPRDDDIRRSNFAAESINRSHFCTFLISYLKRPNVINNPTAEINTTAIRFVSAHIWTNVSRVVPAVDVSAHIWTNISSVVPAVEMNWTNPSNLKLTSSVAWILAHASA